MTIQFVFAGTKGYRAGKENSGCELNHISHFADIGQNN